MKVLTSPVWISPSTEAWRRSDPGPVPGARQSHHPCVTVVRLVRHAGRAHHPHHRARAGAGVCDGPAELRGEPGGRLAGVTGCEVSCVGELLPAARHFALRAGWCRDQGCAVHHAPPGTSTTASARAAAPAAPQCSTSADAAIVATSTAARRAVCWAGEHLGERRGAGTRHPGAGAGTTRRGSRNTAHGRK
jgi:hypothetical protein